MVKMSELKSKSKEDLLKMVLDFKQEKMNMRFQKAYDQLKNPSRLKFIRKDIARIYTELSQRRKNGGANA